MARGLDQPLTLVSNSIPQGSQCLWIGLLIPAIILSPVFSHEDRDSGVVQAWNKELLDRSSRALAY